jgi:hypothetical protein
MHRHARWTLWVGLIALVVVAIEPVAAQNGNGGSTLTDVIVSAIMEALRTLFTPIEEVIEDNADDLLETVVGTPAPDAVFEEPSNGAWPDIYDEYWDVIVPLSLFLWALSVGLVIFFEGTSHLFGSYHRSKLKKRAFTGLLGILSWWWIDALALQFIDQLSAYLVPDLTEVTLFETLSFAAMGVLGVVVALATDFLLFVLIAVIYFVRHIVLYLFTLLMPIMIAFWVPGVGPFSLVSRFMERLAGFYVPFLFMTVPVALLFRLGDILGNNFSLSLGGLGTWLTALIIPIVAVLSPLVLFWQAGALFFMAERASTHVSGGRARQRVNRTRAAGARTRAVGERNTHRGRNFSRGLRGHGALNKDGSKAFGSGDSRANRAGFRVRSRVKRTSGALTDRVTNYRSGRQDTGDGRRFDILRSRIGGPRDGSGQSSRTGTRGRRVDRSAKTDRTKRRDAADQRANTDDPTDGDRS